MPPTRNTCLAKACELSLTTGVRADSSVGDVKQAVLDHPFCGWGRVPMAATRIDLSTALALTVRDRSIRDDCKQIWMVKPLRVG